MYVLRNSNTKYSRVRIRPIEYLLTFFPSLFVHSGVRMGSAVHLTAERGFESDPIHAFFTTIDHPALYTI